MRQCLHSVKAKVSTIKQMNNNDLDMKSMQYPCDVTWQFGKWATKTHSKNVPQYIFLEIANYVARATYGCISSLNWMLQVGMTLFLFSLTSWPHTSIWTAFPLLTVCLVAWCTSADLRKREDLTATTGFESGEGQF